MTETSGAAVTTDAARCLLCGRLLRDEESRRLRLGPSCLKRLRALVEPRPRIRGIPPHPRADPRQLALSLDPEPDQPDHIGSHPIHDIPTGGLL